MEGKAESHHGRPGTGAAWSLEHWKPSALPKSSWREPTSKAADEAGFAIQTRTRSILTEPYHPSHWLIRAKALLLLGYPELATGDAYKAMLLCDAEKSQDSDLVEKVRSARGMRFDRFQRKPHRGIQHDPDRQRQAQESLLLTLAAIRQEVCITLIIALDQTTSYHEAYDHCRNAIAWYPLDERFVQYAKRLAARCLQEDAHKGGFLATKYPWMAFEHQKRSPITMASAIAHMQGISGGICTLAESTMVYPCRKPSRHVKWLDHDQTKPFTITGRAIPKNLLPAKDFDKKSKLPKNVTVPTSDVFGVFATRDIPAHTLLLRDITVTGAANIKTSENCANCFGFLGKIPETSACCAARFCNSLCRDLALASYHVPLCKNAVLNWVSEEAAIRRSHRPNNLLLLRFLATAVHEDSHPLSHELAAVLTGHYTGSHVSTFTLQESIIEPNRMLRDLGIDIFADARFETCILLTLQHRISINKRAEPYAHGGSLIAVNPCFSMFNHSCEPNARWTDSGSTTVEVRALRAIKKGEEIFTDYGGDGEWLTHWFGGRGCRCVKCVAADDEKVGIAL